MQPVIDDLPIKGKTTMRGPRKGTREKEFAKRLKIAMDAHPAYPDGYGRNTYLMRQLAHHNIHVSLETIRKWVEGENMPRRAKMTALAKELRVAETWLAMGEQAALPAGMSLDRIAALEVTLRKIAGMTDDDEIRNLIDTVLSK